MSLVGLSSDDLRFVGMYRALPDGAKVFEDPESSAPFVRLLFERPDRWLGLSTGEFSATREIKANMIRVEIEADAPEGAVLTLREDILTSIREEVAVPAAEAWVADHSSRGLPAQELYDMVKAMLDEGS